MAGHYTLLKSQIEVAYYQNQNFAITLFQAVGKSTEGNICISPFSVAALLSMVHAGAKGNTAKQLKEALGLGKLSDQKIYATIGDKVKSTEGDENLVSKYVLKFVVFCCVKEKFEIKEEFQSIMKENFGAYYTEKVRVGDPEIHKEMSSYVEEFTNKKIEEYLLKNEISHNTLMALVNAVYFKGDWFEQFDPNLTQIKPFFLGSKKSKVDVSMMRLTRTFRTGKIGSLDAQFVELPFKCQKLSMVIILPNKIYGLAKVEANLSGKVLDEMDMNVKQKKLCVKLPKFKIETILEKELMSALNGFGIKDLFKSGAADLSGLSDSPGLFASNIVQKCMIEVDEKGMEAAADITRNVMAMCFPSPVPSFKVDHPAIFLVKDDVTNLVLFVGRLVNPAEK